MGPYRFYQAGAGVRPVGDGGAIADAGGRQPIPESAAGAGLPRLGCANNPMITIKGGGTVYIGQGPTTIYQGKGYCTIVADPPTVIAKPSLTSDAAAIVHTRYDGMRFRGPNITIDIRWI